MKDSFLYKKTYDAIYERIDSGDYPVGSKLPAEDLLCKEYGVSLITVKKALNMLSEQGLINRIPGKGTFITKPGTAAGADGGKLLGVIFEHIASPYGLSMMYYMDEIAAANGFKLLIRFSYCLREKETEEIEFLLNAGVQGLIIMPSHGQHYNPAILKLVLEKFPVILIDKSLQGIEVPSVRTDNSGAMKTLIQYMKGRGCQQIGLITSGESDATSIMERREGFYQGLLEKELEPCPECVLTPQYVYETQEAFDITTRQLRQYLLNHHSRLDGVICSEYSFIPKLVRAAGQLSISLDEDLLVCCIDEDDLAPGGFSFTHMKQDEKEIAIKAMELLLTRLGSGPVKQEDYLVPAIFRKKQPH